MIRRARQLFRAREQLHPTPRRHAVFIPPQGPIPSSTLYHNASRSPSRVTPPPLSRGGGLRRYGRDLLLDPSARDVYWFLDHIERPISSAFTRRPLLSPRPSFGLRGGFADRLRALDRDPTSQIIPPERARRRRGALGPAGYT